MRQCTAAETTPFASLTFKVVYLRRECKEIHLRRFSNKRQQSLSNHAADISPRHYWFIWRKVGPARRVTLPPKKGPPFWPSQLLVS